MTADTPETTAQYEAAYRGGRDAVLSIVSGAMWAVLGAFGVGLLWLATVALTNGTASPFTYAAALFGATLTVLAGDELYHRLHGGTPIF